MPRYIDADKIPYDPSVFGDFDDSVHRYDIDKMPTADVAEVKHGEWIKAECSEKDGDSNCSLCGHFDWSDCNYCSHCGAKMDG